MAAMTSHGSTNSTVFQSYHIMNKSFQFLRVLSLWQQDSKLHLYDIQLKLLEFKYIASQQHILHA